MLNSPLGIQPDRELMQRARGDMVSSMCGMVHYMRDLDSRGRQRQAVLTEQEKAQIAASIDEVLTQTKLVLRGEEVKRVVTGQ